MAWRCDACTIVNYNAEYLACEICGSERAPQSLDRSNVSSGSIVSSSRNRPKIRSAPRPKPPTFEKEATKVENFDTNVGQATLSRFASLSLNDGAQIDGYHSDISNLRLSHSAEDLRVHKELDELQKRNSSGASSMVVSNEGFRTPDSTSEQSSFRTSPSKADLIDTVFGNTEEMRLLLDELITSEHTYVDSLRILVTLFLQPLRAAAKEDDPIIPEKQVHVIFSNIQELMHINIELITAIETQIGGSDSNGTLEHSKSSLDLTVAITHAFKRVIPYFKMYSIYVNNYPNAVETLKSAEQQNSKFAQFLRDASSHAVCKGLNLGAYLIMPVQRLCKYPLFFSRLLKVTDPLNMSYSIIKEAAAIVNDITEKVDLDKDRAQKSLRGFELGNMIQTSTLAKKLNRELHILEPGRQFLYEWEGMVCFGYSQNSMARAKQKCRYMFLFSNLLLICKKHRGYHAKVWISLDELQLGDIQPAINELQSKPLGSRSSSSNRAGGNEAFMIKVIHKHVPISSASFRFSEALALKAGLTRSKVKAAQERKDEYCFIFATVAEQKLIYDLLQESSRTWRVYCETHQAVEFSPRTKSYVSYDGRSQHQTSFWDSSPIARSQSARYARSNSLPEAQYFSDNLPSNLKEVSPDSSSSTEKVSGELHTPNSTANMRRRSNTDERIATSTEIDDSFKVEEPPSAVVIREHEESLLTAKRGPPPARPPRLFIPSPQTISSKNTHIEGDSNVPIEKKSSSHSDPNLRTKDIRKMRPKAPTLPQETPLVVGEMEPKFDVPIAQHNPADELVSKWFGT